MLQRYEKCYNLEMKWGNTTPEGQVKIYSVEWQKDSSQLWYSLKQQKSKKWAPISEETVTTETKWRNTWWWDRFSFHFLPHSIVPADSHAPAGRRYFIKHNATCDYTGHVVEIKKDQEWTAASRISNQNRAELCVKRKLNRKKYIVCKALTLQYLRIYMV